jgi:pyridoxal phosphate enzyme (YggS family)
MPREMITGFDMSGLENVRERLHRICRDLGRPDQSVELICVSKGFSAQEIYPVLDAGEMAFGENRVGEAKAKWPEILLRYPNVKLHLIGPLQSNKADDAVAVFDVIQTVDRPKIAMALAAAVNKSGKRPKFYIQVNTGQEPQKAGIAPTQLGALMEYCRDEAKLEIEGLMCVPPVDQLASPHFALLNQLSRQFGLNELSMGMSGDFELAVQMSATKIRVGSAIFGARSRNPF